jgi:hypothetical protein
MVEIVDESVERHSLALGGGIPGNLVADPQEPRRS